MSKKKVNFFSLIFGIIIGVANVAFASSFSNYGSVSVTLTTRNLNLIEMSRIKCSIYH